MAEFVEATRRLTAVLDIPVVVDAGARFGEPLHTMRTVRELARVETELARYARRLRRPRRSTRFLGQRRDPIPDAATLRTMVLKCLDGWTAVARQRIAEARRLLRAVLVDRLVLTPVVRPPELPPRKGPGRKPRFVYEFNGEAHRRCRIATGRRSRSSLRRPRVDTRRARRV